MYDVEFKMLSSVCLYLGESMVKIYEREPKKWATGIIFRETHSDCFSTSLFGCIFSSQLQFSSQIVGSFPPFTPILLNIQIKTINSETRESSCKNAVIKDIGSILFSFIRTVLYQSLQPH